MIIKEKNQKIIDYLKKRDLLELYKKKRNQLETDNAKSAQFKKRQPYKYQMFYFRINKQYRAIGRFKGSDFIVTEISDHQ